MLLSIAGNVTVLCVLLYHYSSATYLNAFLINLAIADLLMAIFCMPFTFPTIMLGHWIFGAKMCPTVIFLQQVSVIVSVCTLTAVGIDRYFAVIYPLTVRVTKNRGKIVFVLIWLIAISLATIQTIFVSVDEIYYDGRYIYFCSERFPSYQFAKVYEIFFIMITYTSPLFILCFTYMRIGLRLWGRTLPGNADTSRDQSQTRAKKKVIKMLVIIVVMFALCWLPVHVFKFVNIAYPLLYQEVRHQDKMRAANCVILWIAMANSFVNPFVYGFFNEGFRNDLKAMVNRSSRMWLRQGHPKTRRSRSLSSQSSLRTRTFSISSMSFLRKSQRSSRNVAKLTPIDNSAKTEKLAIRNSGAGHLGPGDET
ncbi:RYamide receptor-like isoform X2 [Ptychodera flava]|uniref:RYamide receptor-like isoform X2 n=1 Tax=Ptychodera flava TaxID=63121 RepID=UPI00396A63B6